MATVSTMGLVSKQASIEALSGKLLEGYTLLAESCPAGCNVPLVRAAAGGESLCVSCGGNPPAPRAAQTPQRAAAACPGAEAAEAACEESRELREYQLETLQGEAEAEISTLKTKIVLYLTFHSKSIQIPITFYNRYSPNY